MLKPNWHPERRTLRQFAALWLLFLSLAGLLRAWRGGAFDVPFEAGGPWGIPLALVGLAIAIGVPGMLAPGLVRPLYVGLMTLTFPIGWVISHILLGVVYFGLFAGIGLVFRMIGRDRLNIRFGQSKKTYWKDRQTPPDPVQYFKLS